VILLHGTPGSGKTLSAETAAEGTHKALVSTSLGELNRDNMSVHQSSFINYSTDIDIKPMDF
jgi:ATP-dependent 26S proteasome regulatory subunit